MPIYEFHCEKCDCVFEHLQLASDKSTPQCPSCCDTKVTKLISAGSFRPNGIPAGSGGFGKSGCTPSGGG